MSYYRNVYLKSEEWRVLRLACLHRARYRCEVCGQKSPSLDAHHLKYRRLHDVHVQDLKAICRECHEAVHVLLRKYPKLRTLRKGKQWRIVLQQLKRNGVRVAPSLPTRIGRFKIHRHFSLCRRVLIKMRLIRRHQMPWHDDLLYSGNHRFDPMSFLKQYIAITGNDPRRGFMKPMRVRALLTASSPPLSVP